MVMALAPQGPSCLFWRISHHTGLSLVVQALMGLTLEASAPLWTSEHLRVVLTVCPPGPSPLCGAWAPAHSRPSSAHSERSCVRLSATPGSCDTSVHSAPGGKPMGVCVCVCKCASVCVLTGTYIWKHWLLAPHHQHSLPSGLCPELQA